jgi:hypothetical protein
LVTKLHILLTYNCSLKCKHCYVYSDQRAPGKISLSQINHYLNDGRKIEGIEWVYFGGGEPFTQYPLLLKAIQRARKLDYRVGVETNGYFARTEESALRMLRPLANMAVEDLRVSNDSIHYKNPTTSPANRALIAARELGIPTTLVQVSPPGSNGTNPASSPHADRIDQPRFIYAGRAAELFADQILGVEHATLTSCPGHDLTDPDRVYIDAYGYVQICPGIVMGNARQAPLNEIITNYDAKNHDILGVLAEFGPAGLIEQSGLPSDTKIVDACHGCYKSRKQLIDEYPDLLGPRHVYGY